MSDILSQFLPKSMFQSIERLPQGNQPVVLLTRHSIRELADSNGFTGYQLPLTPIGRELAFAWGQWLGSNTRLQLAACLSSPISRCVDTASLMLQGVQAIKKQPYPPLSIDQHNLLVEPGSFVLDIAQAGPYFRRQGALHFINGFLNQQLPGMKIPLQGAQDILRLLFEHMPQQDNGLLLAVSHDTILSALFAILQNKVQITQQDWPEMMEGSFLWFEMEPPAKEKIKENSVGYECIGAKPPQNYSFENSIVNWIWRGEHYRFKPENF